MSNTKTRLLRQEVEELTELLRHDPDWQDLRAAIESVGWAASAVLLAGFMEDEYENEFGAVVTDDGQVFDFERDSRRGSKGFKRWQRVEQADTLLDTFPAVAEALAMAAGQS